MLIWSIDAGAGERVDVAPQHRLALFNKEARPGHLRLLSSDVAIAACDDIVHVVDVVTGQQRRQLSQQHRDGPITAMATLEQTSVFVCGYCSGAIVLWSTEEDACLWRIDAHVGAITALAMDNDKVVSAGMDERAIVWEALSGAYRCSFRLSDRSSNDIDSAVSVSSLHLGSSELVAVVGDRVKSWTIGHRRHRLVKQEIEEEIEDTAQYLARTRQEAEYRRHLRATYTVEGLSEEELLHYTMMLSLEESSHSTSTSMSASADNHDSNDEDEDAATHHPSDVETEWTLAQQEEQDLEEAIRLSMQYK
ncbi:hypothetical protein SYNPS1DRAFT_30202 [Syncephalis pseudoplumigaleata]|uniref:Uncharacterized protein n=1 Tax=Syncephalis pseudoplumigaleata TaxID=1712513 RepID=A0A4P9YYF1_9FUNG|nr:hypothetical protein SYNPS1DRAFT_30202 [Syncephalis pseudoplumigaleata]|eukprot:RKP24030.1 hypothetical protein SYNPS1DRAFT_30202 [Syncephalis pseudoplumigaleata]